MASGAGAQLATTPAGGCCCCGGGCCDCPKDFQKVLELKDVGLVVYRHTARTEERNKITGLLESATTTTDDVFILLNTKSSELTSAQYLPGIKTTKISCPRCRLFAERVHGLLQRAPNIERNHVSGICDRCLMRGQPCYNCERILNKFVSNGRDGRDGRDGRVSEGTKTSIRQWLSKIQHLLDDITGAGAGVDHQRHGGLPSGRIRASSELYVDQILMRSRKDARQLDIKPLFRARPGGGGGGVTLDERGRVVEDRSRFLGTDISGMLGIFGETTSRRGEYERDLDGWPRRWQHDTPTSTRAVVGLSTRRSHSEVSIPSFARTSKGEAVRRGRDYGESNRFQEEYRRRGEGREFIEPGDIKSQRYRDHREVSESYARGDAHYKGLKTVRSRSIGPTRKGTRVDTSAGSRHELAQRGDRSIDEFGKSKERSKVDYRKHDEIETRTKAKDMSKREDKNSYYKVKDEGREGAHHEVTKGERTARKKDQKVKVIEHDSNERLKYKKEEQKQRHKDETGKTKPDKSDLAQHDQLKLKSEKDKRAKDKSGQEQKQKGEKELSTKDKGGKEQKQKGEKELSTKDKSGKEQKQKGEKGLNTKGKGGPEPKQKVEKRLSIKDKGGQEPKQKEKGEKELSTKDKTTQVPTLKGEKELSSKDKGVQEQKPKVERELGTKDAGEQEKKQKGEKELSAKDKSGQEQKPKREKELGIKDTDGQESKQKGEKELSPRDKGGQEQKPKGEKELGTKDKGGQESQQKDEEVLSTKDKSEQELKQKGKKELSTIDKDGQEQKSKEEIELSFKDTGGQEPKQKEEKELSTKDKGGQEQKAKGEKKIGTKDKGGQEPKQKGEKALSTKHKGEQDQKQEGTGEKESALKDKGATDARKKGKGEKEREIIHEPKQKGNVEKESDSKDKEAPDKKSKDEKVTDTKKKGKGEKEMDSKDRDDKEPKQKEIGSKDKEKKEKPDQVTIIMEQKIKELKFKDYTGPKEKGERQRGIKDEYKEEDRGKVRRTGKKREETKKGEDKKEKDKENLQNKKKESIEEEKELSVNKIRVRRASPDDLILRLVKLKQTFDFQRRPDIDIELRNIEKIIRSHFDTKHEDDELADLCPFCCDSDYDMELLREPTAPEYAEVIFGSKVYRFKPPLSPRITCPEEHQQQSPVVPIQFKATYQAENIVQITALKEDVPLSPVTIEEKKDDSKPSKKSRKPSKAQEAEVTCTKGIINFKLSDRSFIEKGWTKLPTEKVVRKMNVYRMRPAHPEFNWFERNKRKRLMTYESGERLAEFDDEGRGRWYYRNGRLALDYYDAEGLNAQQRFVIWSNGEPDERGRARPYTILATFDYLGNGIVFDHTGKIRLKYNQTEGIVLDRSVGPVSHWKWHSLNDPPVLAQVMIDTQETQRDPRLVELGSGVGPGAGTGVDGHCADRTPRPDDDEMLAIEFDNYVRAKGEKLTQPYKPFQIKMKALKINEYFSLKVLDQATVYLIYRDGRTNLKLNLGMVLDEREIVDTDNAELGEVPSELERYPARSESLAALQRGVQRAQRWERRRAARDRRLHPAPPAPPSVDRLAAAASRSPPPALDTAPALCRCARKPTGPSLYYDNRIF